MAQTLTLNDKIYNIDDLSDEANRLANNIIFAEAKLTQLNNEAALVQTARSTYTKALTAILEPADAGAESTEE